VNVISGKVSGAIQKLPHKLRDVIAPEQGWALRHKASMPQSKKAISACGMKLPPFTTALTCDTYRDELGKRSDAVLEQGRHDSQK
jgi:hypothetical protein